MDDIYCFEPVSKVGGKPPGMRNLGNICYMTSVLQCLLTTGVFSKAVYNGHFTYAAHHQPITRAFENLCLDVAVCQDSSYDCKEFLDTVQQQWTEYVPNAQLDSREFLGFLLQSLHTETMEVDRLPPPLPNMHDLGDYVHKNWQASQKSIIQKHFAVQLVTLTNCRSIGCYYENVQCDDPTPFLTVSIPSHEACSLQECLKYYFSEASPEYAKCPNCKEENTLQVKVVLGRLPPILIFQLGRFSHHGGRDASKNSTPVSYEQELDLNDHTIDKLQSNTQYHLIAVTLHHGAFLDAGHYTAYSRRDDRWFHFDDSKASNITSRRVVTDKAYLLWYELQMEKEEKLYPLDSETISIMECEPLTSCTHNNIKKSSLETQLGEDQMSDLNNNTDSLSMASEVGDVPEPETQVVEDHRTYYVTEVESVPAVGAGDELPLTSPSVSSSALSLTLPFRETQAEVQNDLVPFCNHPGMDLEVDDPLLQEHDVEGALLDLEKIKKYPVKNLQRWLSIRRLPISGNKQELIERIENHVASGKAGKIDPGIDSGLWHNIKRKKLASHRPNRNELPMIPTGFRVWSPFPSIHIPEGYEYANILDYFQDIPDFTYSYKEGVVVVPPTDVMSSFHDNTTDDDTDDVDEYEAMTFKELCRRAVMKCIKKGEDFLASGRVLSVFDTKRSNHYFIKAQVQASMDSKIYVVFLVLNISDGSICGAECCCKAKNLRRCGHIAAVCILLWEHVSRKGFEATTTTGRECYWRTKAKPKDPSFIHEKQYPTRKSLIKRVKYDPRPKEFQDYSKISTEALQTLRDDLEKKIPFCLLRFHIECNKDDTSHNVDLSDPLNLEIVSEKCSRRLWMLSQQCKGHSRPFQVPNTHGQHFNPQWHLERRGVVTASTAKALLGLSTDQRKISFLRSTVWGLDKKVYPAMQYGIDHEDEARKQFTQYWKNVLGEDVQVVETGMWKNPKFPQMSCSPDGFLIHEYFGSTILLEIKCLTRTHVDPKQFDTEMTKQEKNRFYLRRNDEGTLEVKPSHPYYYQIQHSLGVLELEVCHLYVWSESGDAIVQVLYDPAFWEEKRRRLINRHRELVIPETVLGRTKRHLPPLELVYTPFHEDPNDDYFESN